MRAKSCGRLRNGRWLLIGLVSGSLALAGVPGDDDDLARELPRIPSMSTDQALKSFQIQPGFRLSLAAAEPLVTDPVSACYDADGRLYVVEMRGYPYPENSPTGNVRRLEDTNGDGTFDKSTVFADGLSWPTGVLASDGGVFITVAPDIIYAKDTNGDGVADLQRVMFSGFGTQNVQGLVNGLIWGPDGWIYGTSSSNGGEIQNRTHPDQKLVSVRGQDFRFRPDGSAFEAIAGGGQFGHAFDDWGHRFTCNNSNHIRQIVLEPGDLASNPALTVPSVIQDIAVEGPAAPVFRISAPEPWRVVRTRQRVADPEMLAKLAPTERFAAGFFTSATGVTIYRGTAYPAEYQGNAFIGDVGANLVHRKLLAARGAEFQATRADQNVEFLASPDNWFRPVNFVNTPSGTLLILDMYRETIEHPFSIPEPIKKHLDLTSGRDKGRLYELLPESFQRRPAPHLSQATSAELASLLDDPDAWWRETAQRLLLERRDPAAIALVRNQVTQAKRPQGRVHALWTLAALGALSDADLLATVRDSNPHVRQQVAALFRTLKAPGRALEDRVAGLATDPDAGVRFQVALALGSMAVTPDRPLREQLAILERDATDPWTRLAVYASAAGTQATSLLIAVLGLTPPSAEGRGMAQSLAELIGAGGSVSDVELALGWASDTAVDSRSRHALIRGLGRGLQRAGKSLRALVSQSPRPELTTAFAEAAQQASDNSLELSARVDAIQIVGLGPLETTMATLPELLDARQPTELQMAALRALGEQADPRVGPAVIERWKAISPGTQREAVEVLLARPERLNALLDAVEAKQVPAGALEPTRRKGLLEHANAQIQARAAKLFGGELQSDRAAVIASFKPALALEGQPASGRGLFQKACAPCHKAEGQGEAIGPDLATVVGRTAEDLIVHIIDPNREVLPQYLDYSVATTDGRIFTGLIASETPGAVTLKRAGNVTDVIARPQIEAIASSGRSLMPEGLEKALSHQDLADLIGFLKSIQPAAPATK